jgi:hypothetical protein
MGSRSIAVRVSEWPSRLWPLFPPGVRVTLTTPAEPDRRPRRYDPWGKGRELCAADVLRALDRHSPSLSVSDEFELLCVPSVAGGGDRTGRRRSSPRAARRSKRCLRGVSWSVRCRMRRRPDPGAPRTGSRRLRRARSSCRLTAFAFATEPGRAPRRFRGCSMRAFRTWMRRHPFDPDLRSALALYTLLRTRCVIERQSPVSWERAWMAEWEAFARSERRRMRDRLRSALRRLQAAACRRAQTRGG